MDHKKDHDILAADLTSCLDDYVASSTAYESTDTITLSSLGSINTGLGGVSLTSPYTVTGSMTSTAQPLFTTGTNATPWYTSNSQGGKIQLDGQDADITVRGWSLVDAVKRIEERLGLYQPNPELEKEWQELHDLADQYRQLEQHIKDKQATFDRLKAMPPPQID